MYGCPCWEKETASRYFRTQIAELAAFLVINQRQQVTSTSADASVLQAQQAIRLTATVQHRGLWFILLTVYRWPVDTRTGAILLRTGAKSHPAPSRATSETILLDTAVARRHGWVCHSQLTRRRWAIGEGMCRIPVHFDFLPNSRQREWAHRAVRGRSVACFDPVVFFISLFHVWFWLRYIILLYRLFGKCQRYLRAKNGSSRRSLFFERRVCLCDSTKTICIHESCFTAQSLRSRNP